MTADMTKINRSRMTCHFIALADEPDGEVDPDVDGRDGRHTNGVPVCEAVGIDIDAHIRSVVRMDEFALVRKRDMATTIAGLDSLLTCLACFSFCCFFLLAIGLLGACGR